MDGFVTLAVGDRYLQMAAALALSARRFGYETILMHRDADPRRYGSLFAETFGLTGRPTANRAGVGAARELKKYAYEASERFGACAFLDADSLVIRNPAGMFQNLRSETIHTPAGRDVAADQTWAAPRGVPTLQAARAMGAPHDRAVQTLNGGFLYWTRGEEAQRWFADYGSLFGRLQAYLEGRLQRRCGVGDELCAGIAFALSGVRLWKSDSSIGVWDAFDLKLDIERQEFECAKHYYWERHRFRPYVAHFGGSAVGSRYRQCVGFLRRDADVDLPLFDDEAPVDPPRPRLRGNAYSISDAEVASLRRFVEQQGVRTVLEFGPGRSTECFLDAECRVWSFEYQPRWLDHYRRVLGDRPRLTLGLFENRETVVLPPLPQARFDMAFVDAPTGADRAGDAHCSRLNTVLAAASLTDLVLLHDANRAAEQATIEHVRGLGWSCEWLPDAPKVAVLRRRREAAAYDFSHWPALPRVSCQCITYGRTSLLDEAVESFLRQDYPGWKELVILNDLPSLTLRLEHPQVKVVNLPYRMRTIGEKRNACVALCEGDVIFPWDDDDISLPHRISYSLQQMTNRRYFKSDRMWTWRKEGVQPEPKKALAHAMGCWSRELFDEVGGYAPIQSGQDAALEERFKGRGRFVEQTPDDRVYYIYRFADMGTYHLSAFGYGRGYREAERWAQAKSIGGVYEIQPQWRHDYAALVTEVLRSRERTL